MGQGVRCRLLRRRAGIAAWPLALRMTTKNAARVARKRVGPIRIVLIIHCNVVLVQFRDLERVFALLCGKNVLKK